MERLSALITTICIMIAHAIPSTAQNQLTITVLYDNTLCDQSAVADWGFSCIINGLEKVVLFDAGASAKTLASNVRTLGVQLSQVELAVFSHDHRDHTGGLTEALVAGPQVTAFIGNTFSASTEQAITSTGAKAIRVSAARSILPGLRTTGEVAGGIPEQALVMSVDSGLVVILGCSHPGVITMLGRVRELSGRNIYMVLGGFHWPNFTDSEITRMIHAMRELGVTKCGATHCTGDRAIALLRQAFGADFVDMGVGRVITLSRSPGVAD